MYDRPFRWWVQSVMPLVFDDSLSYYEVLAKLTKYIEGLTGDVEQIEKVLETIEGIEDITQFTEFLERIQAEIGNLENLQTDTKANLVSAINEVALKADIAYWKPPTGIPESDLSQEVQNKLNNAGGATKYIINNKELKAAPSNNSPNDLGLGTYSVPSGGIPWDTLSDDVKSRINAGGSGGTSDYSDLNNKPEINGHTLNAGDNTAESLGLGTYSKPIGGIPESDLSAEVQEKLNTSGGIADNQASFVASRDYEAGELLYINGVLYKTNVKILRGTTMIPGNNIETTDISAELAEINSDIEALQSGSGPDSWSLSAEVESSSSTNRVDFFEYFNCIGGENYNFIVDPVNQNNATYYIAIKKRDGTIVFTEYVSDIDEARNRVRFTFAPTDTGEYFCTFYRGTDTSTYTAACKVTIEYTQSQGMTELWTKVNEATQLEPRVEAVETLSTQNAGNIEDLNEDLNNTKESINNTLRELVMVPVTYKDNCYINTNVDINAEVDLTEIPHQTYASAVLDCQEGEKVRVRATGGTNPKVLAFLDSDNILLFKTTTNNINHTYVAPENTAKVVLNAAMTGPHWAYIGNDIKEDITHYGFFRQTININTTEHRIEIPAQRILLGDTFKDIQATVVEYDANVYYVNICYNIETNAFVIISALNDTVLFNYYFFGMFHKGNEDEACINGNYTVNGRYPHTSGDDTSTAYESNAFFTGKNDVGWVGNWTKPEIVSFERVRNKLYWSFTSHSGAKGVGEFDFNTKTCNKRVLSKLGVADLHNDLAIHVFSDGTILAAYSTGHNTDNNIRIRKSVSPENIEYFTDEIVLPCQYTTTYAQLIESSGKLYLFYRNGVYRWAYRYSADNGDTWSNEVNLIVSDAQYYCMFVKTNTSNMIRCLSYTNPQASPCDTKIRQSFFNTTDNVLYNSDGITALGTNDVNKDNITVLIDNDATLTNQRLLDCCVTDVDKPLVLYAPFSTFYDSMYRVYNNGTIFDVYGGGSPLTSIAPYFLGGCFIDNSKVVVCYGRGVGGGTDYVAIYDITEQAATLNKIIFSELRGSNGIRNFYPIVDADRKAVMWLRGIYGNTYTDFNTDAKIYLIDDDEII